MAQSSPKWPIIAHFFANIPQKSHLSLGNFADFVYICTVNLRNIINISMNKYEIPFINACIMAFSKRFALTRRAAYDYLQRHRGLAFLIDFYDVEHLQSLEDTVDDLVVMCNKNGGTLA